LASSGRKGTGSLAPLGQTPLRSMHFGESRACRARKAEDISEERGMRGEGWRLPPVLRQLQCPLVHRQRPDSLGEKAAQPVAPWPFSREAVGDEYVHQLPAHRELVPVVLGLRKLAPAR